jgi:hypothetical protein
LILSASNLTDFEVSYKLCKENENLFCTIGLYIDPNSDLWSRYEMKQKDSGKKWSEIEAIDAYFKEIEAFLTAD